MNIVDHQNIIVINCSQAILQMTKVNFIEVTVIGIKANELLHISYRFVGSSKILTKIPFSCMHH